MIPRAYLLAFALPIVFAVMVLGASAANGRSARGPTVVSEREATLGARSSDRSIAEVWLGWTEPAGRPATWMTRDVLDGLGFEFDVAPADPEAAPYYQRQLSRRAFVAFELDGPAWQAVLDERVRAQGSGERAPVDGRRTNGSRLVPVAVDRVADVLAQRFPNPGTHLIAAATVRVALFRPPNGTPYVGGMLVNIDPRRIQIPAERAASLPRRSPEENPQSTPFRISLMYGARWEPWVVDVEAGQQR